MVKKVLFHDATVPYERTKSTTSFPVVPSSYLDEAEKREDWDLHVLVSREVALLKAKFIAEIVMNGKPQSPCCVGDVQHVQIQGTVLDPEELTFEFSDSHSEHTYVSPEEIALDGMHQSCDLRGREINIDYTRCCWTNGSGTRVGSTT